MSSDIYPGSVPESVSVVYDECLNLCPENDFTSVWYGIFRRALAHENDGVRQKDPAAVLVVPYQTSDCVMGFGLAGVHIGEDRLDVVMLKLLVEYVDQGEDQATLASGDFEINVTSRMANHLMDIATCYQEVAEVDGVLQPEDRHR
jgi:hypothetical protein